PTLSIMYGYALESGNVLNATAVFATYALTTVLAVSGVIYRISTLLKTLRKNWIETAIMRTAGIVTILFSSISLYQL
ncbi:MAG: sulfite exporter TauE/SafE family protein, partial [Deltaproteobacteria bacterium]|nr:sulfite exporter TauE/SafE family protein [Deltaproteobacteria bacterium]